MSVQDFIKDPVSYARSHPLQFGPITAEEAGMRVVQTSAQQGWNAVRYDMEPAHFTDFRFNGDTAIGYMGAGNQWVHGYHVQIGRGNMHIVMGKPSYQDRGICFLPWAANSVTYVRIPASAKTFFTGPLSGCSIYIGEGTDGSLWAFHANRNAAGGANNTAVKHAMTALTLRGMNVVVRVKHAAIYKQQYNDLGFVCGTKNWRGAWSFYAGDLPLVAPAVPCIVNRLP